MCDNCKLVMHKDSIIKENMCAYYGKSCKDAEKSCYIKNPKEEIEE